MGRIAAGRKRKVCGPRHVARHVSRSRHGRDERGIIIPTPEQLTAPHTAHTAIPITYYIVTYVELLTLLVLIVEEVWIKNTEMRFGKKGYIYEFKNVPRGNNELFRFY